MRTVLNGWSRLGVRRGLMAAVAVAALAYAGWLVAWMAPVAAGSDSSGYLAFARMLGQGSIDQPIVFPEGIGAEERPAVWWRPLGMVENREGTRWSPTYPLGWPLVLAPFVRVGGEAGVGFVMLLVAGLALASTYRIGREVGLAPDLAVLATSPIFFFQAAQPMSDVAALLWCNLALLAGWRAREGGGRAGPAVLAGVLVGLAVLTRPTNLLLVVPLAFIFGLRLRCWAGLAAGGAGPALVQVLLAKALYGSYLATGYGSQPELFGFHLVLPTLATLLRWTPELLTLAGGAGLAAALLLPLTWRDPRRRSLLVWLACLLGFYSFYRHTAEHWIFLRFLLPAVPAALVLAAGAWQDLLGRERPWPRLRMAAVAALVVVTGVAILHNGWSRMQQLHVRDVLRSESTYREAARWIAGEFGPSDVVVAMQMSGAIRYHAPAVPHVRWDVMSPARWSELVAELDAAGVRTAAALFNWEIDLLRESREWDEAWQERERFGQIRIFARVPSGTDED